MRFYRLRRRLQSLYVDLPDVQRQRAGLLAVFLVVSLAMLVAGMGVRLLVGNGGTVGLLRQGGLVLAVLGGLVLLFRGRLVASINVILGVLVVNALVLLPNDISRLFFAHVIYAMLGFSVVYVRNYQYRIAQTVFPGLVLIKTLYEEWQRSQGIEPRSTLEMTLLTILVIIGLVPILRSMVLLLDREILRSSALWDQNKRLSGEAFVDALTGASNRRYFTRVGGLCLDNAMRNGQDVGLIFMDLDHFKECNDTHGHQEGDRILQALGAAMRVRLRRTDIFARWGGDEFVMLCPGMDRNHALHFCQELLSGLGDLPLFRDRGVGISMGYCQWRHGENLDSIMARADALLYEAKHQGRGRVVFDHDQSRP